MKKYLKWLMFFSSLFLFGQFVANNAIHVTGSSMEPTIPHDAYVFSLKNKAIKRFDVITFQAPDETQSKYIKRVIGLPGEIIEFIDDVLYISGEPVAEKYLTTKNGIIHTDDFQMYEQCGQIIIPPHHYFVLGDNRPISNDSRIFGFISKESIERTATFVLWPPEAMGFIKNEHEFLEP